MHFKIIVLSICVGTCRLLQAAPEILEVKPDKQAIVRMSASGEATEITRLAAGTRVTKIGEVPRWYSIQMADGNNGWSTKASFNVVDSGTAPAGPAVPVTPETLLRRTDVLKIAVIDVEVGDATLIFCPSENNHQDVLLIDTGQNDGDRIEKELKDNGFVTSLKPITRFYLTHYDRDHIGDAPRMIPEAQIVYDHGENNIDGSYKTAVTKPGVDRRLMRLNYQGTFSGGVVVKCVAVNNATAVNPNQPPATTDSDNPNSIALIISFDNFDYFTAGDLTFSAETNLARSVQNCDVYHVNHHGSKATSSHIDFVTALDPEVSIASNGRQYSHPTAVVAQRLLSIGSKFFQTNVNPQPEAYHPTDVNFIADATFTSSTAEQNEGAKGTIRVVVDPNTHRYHVLMGTLPFAQGTFPIEN